MTAKLRIERLGELVEASVRRCNEEDLRVGLSSSVPVGIPPEVFGVLNEAAREALLKDWGNLEGHRWLINVKIAMMGEEGGQDRPSQTEMCQLARVAAGMVERCIGAMVGEISAGKAMKEVLDTLKNVDAIIRTAEGVSFARFGGRLVVSNRPLARFSQPFAAALGMVTVERIMPDTVVVNGRSFEPVSLVGVGRHGVHNRGITLVDSTPPQS